MKRILVVAVVTAFVLVAGLAMAASIRGSKHDLSSTGSGYKAGGTVNEICVFCHTPHGAGTLAPLWNRSATGVTYTPYSSATLSATVGQPSASSMACLTCHDGTIAIATGINVVPSGKTVAAGADAGNVVNDLMTGVPRIGGGADLSSTHPISMAYNTSDTKLKPTPSIAKILGGNVECGSCHAVHDPANTPFLRGTNANSALCLDCHNK